MALITAEVAPANPSALKFQRIVELISRNWVLLIAGIYGSGYLVVSIYNSSLGINELNPLRPRIASAGLLLLSASGIALFLYHYAYTTFLRDADGIRGRQQRFVKVTYGGLSLFLCDFFAASVVSVPLARNHILTTRIVWLLGVWGGSLVLVVFAHGTRARFVQKWMEHWTFPTVCGLAVLAMVTLSIPRTADVNVGIVAIFFGSVQIATHSIARIIRNPLWYYFWTLLPLDLFIPLVLFSLLIYPHTKAAFGGGEPTRAEIMLQPSAGGTPTEIKVTIIDETDFGIYLIEEGDKRVQFIPRASVASVTFDKPQGLF